MKRLGQLNIRHPVEGKLDILTIADMQGTLTKEKYLEMLEGAEIVFLIGNNTDADIAVVSENTPFDVSVIGISGNETDTKPFRKYVRRKIRDMNSNAMAFGGYKLCGFGSTGTDPNTETETILNLPSCDILIAYDAPSFKITKKGVPAVGAYIEEYHPKVVFCGHAPRPARHSHKGTIIRSCNGLERVRIWFADKKRK